MRLPLLILGALIAFAGLFAVGASREGGEAAEPQGLPPRVGQMPDARPIEVGRPPALPTSLAPAAVASRAAPAAPAPTPAPLPPPRSEPAPQAAPPEPALRPQRSPQPEPSPRSAPPTGAAPFSDVE